MINVTSSALEASKVISTSPCRLKSLSIYNSSLSDQFILLFDAIAVPADGAAPSAAAPFKVGTGETYMIDYGDIGRTFNVGVCVSNSSTDTTKTIGANDCWFDAQILPIDGDPKNYR